MKSPDRRSRVQNSGNLVLPLAGTWTLDGAPRVRLSGFEYGEADVFAHAVVRGNSLANVLSVTACTGEVDGGQGNDAVFLYEMHRCSPQRDAFIARGGSGADTLQGSGVGDLLIGGPGRDVAYGDGGADRCVAERTRC